MSGITGDLYHRMGPASRPRMCRSRRPALRAERVAVPPFNRQASARAVAHESGCQFSPSPARGKIRADCASPAWPDDTDLWHGADNAGPPAHPPYACLAALATLASRSSPLPRGLHERCMLTEAAAPGFRLHLAVMKCSTEESGIIISPLCSLTPKGCLSMRFALALAAILVSQAHADSPLELNVYGLSACAEHRP